MPEGRMLKKKISDSRRVNNLSSDSARLLYTWLIPHLDVEGRFSADAHIVKGHVFPRLRHMTPQKIEKMLAELAENGLIILYENDGDSFLQLRRFADEQSLRKDREKPSEIPAPQAPQAIPTLSPGATPGATPAQDKLREVKLREENTRARAKDKIEIREYLAFTAEELDKLKERFPRDQLEWAFDYLNNKIETKGYKYKSHYALFKQGSWLLDEMEKRFRAEQIEKDKTEDSAVDRMRELEKQFTPEQIQRNKERLIALGKSIGKKKPEGRSARL